VTVTTDSEYVANGFRKGWVEGWKRRGWVNSKREPVKNRDLWELLDAEVERHEVSWEWVRGHRGHAYNERCDRLAVSAATAAAV
jgi:ribonuclease HI